MYWYWSCYDLGDLIDPKESELFTNRSTSFQPVHTHNARAGSSAIIIMIGMAVIGTLGGCQKSALRPDDPRSQFERYDQARNEHAQPFLQDEFGRRTPNLSERLLDRSQ